MIVTVTGPAEFTMSAPIDSQGAGRIVSRATVTPSYVLGIMPKWQRSTVHARDVH